MEKLFRNKKDIVFWIVAIILFLLLLAYNIYSISFLVNKINSVFNPNLIKGAEIVRFNLNKIKELRR